MIPSPVQEFVIPLNGERCSTKATRAQVLRADSCDFADEDCHDVILRSGRVAMRIVVEKHVRHGAFPTECTHVLSRSTGVCGCFPTFMSVRGSHIATGLGRNALAAGQDSRSSTREDGADHRRPKLAMLCDLHVAMACSGHVETQRALFLDPQIKEYSLNHRKDPLII